MLIHRAWMVLLALCVCVGGLTLASPAIGGSGGGECNADPFSPTCDVSVDQPGFQHTPAPNLRVRMALRRVSRLARRRARTTAPQCRALILRARGSITAPAGAMCRCKLRRARHLPGVRQLWVRGIGARLTAHRHSFATALARRFGRIRRRLALTGTRRRRPRRSWYARSSCVVSISGWRRARRCTPMIPQALWPTVAPGWEFRSGFGLTIRGR
jgi:hypothetical protein